MDRKVALKSLYCYGAWLKGADWMGPGFPIFLGALLWRESLVVPWILWTSRAHVLLDKEESCMDGTGSLGLSSLHIYGSMPIWERLA